MQSLYVLFEKETIKILWKLEIENLMNYVPEKNTLFFIVSKSDQQFLQCHISLILKDQKEDGISRNSCASFIIDHLI